MDFTGAAWRKSSRSGSDSTGNCVEVAFTSAVVGVRDSKNLEGSTLVVTDAAWRAFAAGIRG